MLLFGRNSRLKAILKLVKKTSCKTSKTLKDKEKFRILHLKISKYLFEAVNKNDYAIIKTILYDNYVMADMVFDDNCLNIVEHSIINNNDILFDFLSTKAYPHIKCYFDSIPKLFTLAANKKSLGIVKTILKDNRFANKLERMNIPPCLYLAVRNNDIRIFQLIVENDYLLSLIDGRDVRSYLIYMISHKQYNEMKVFLSNPQLINKCDEANIINLFTVSLINRDDKAIEKLLENKYFASVIEHSDEDLLMNLMLLANNNGNLGLMLLLNKNKNITAKIQHKDEENNKIIDFKNIKKISG